MIGVGGVRRTPRDQQEGARPSESNEGPGRPLRDFPEECFWRLGCTRASRSCTGARPPGAQINRFIPPSARSCVWGEYVQLSAIVTSEARRAEQVDVRGTWERTRKFVYLPADPGPGTADPISSAAPPRDCRTLVPHQEKHNSELANIDVSSRTWLNYSGAGFFEAFCCDPTRYVTLFTSGGKADKC